MSKVTFETVLRDEDGMRLDRWFFARYPGWPRGYVQKSIRKGQVRLDGARAKAATRVTEGQSVRVPPPPVSDGPKGERKRPPVSKADARMLEEAVLYMDADMIVIDKPHGLAVQGGTKTARHLDGMLDALKFGKKERPRLVHRLDRGTSGVLALARTAPAARFLTSAFKSRETAKTYLALVVGVPDAPEGRIDAALSKKPGKGGERMMHDAENGQYAVTAYRVLDTVGGRFALVAFKPETGRTHQLRVHATLLGCPIAGDGRYGRSAAFPDELEDGTGLHLHAAALSLLSPSGTPVSVRAPLPVHMEKSLSFLGLNVPAGFGVEA